jgi:hypothetical protein
MFLAWTSPMFSSRVCIDGYIIRVEQADGRRVRQLRFQRSAKTQARRASNDAISMNPEPQSNVGVTRRFNASPGRNNRDDIKRCQEIGPNLPRLTMPVRFDHIDLCVPDIAATIPFYR